jgi:hypothetical protein
MNYDVGTVGRGGPVVRRSSRRLPDACPVVDAHVGSGRDRPLVRCRGSAGRPPRPDGTPSRTSARRSPLRTAGTSPSRATSPASTTSKRCARLSRARSTRSRSLSRPPVTARLSRPEGPRRRHDHCDVVAVARRPSPMSYLAYAARAGPGRPARRPGQLHRARDHPHRTQPGRDPAASRPSCATCTPTAASAPPTASPGPRCSSRSTTPPESPGSSSTSSADQSSVETEWTSRRMTGRGDA